MTSHSGMVRQVTVEKLYTDNQARLGMNWLAGRQGGNKVLTGEAELKPTITGLPRGQLAVGDNLLSVWGDKLVRTLPDGSETVFGGEALIGTGPVTMACNMRLPPDVVLVDNGSVYYVNLTTMMIGNHRTEGRRALSDRHTQITLDFIHLDFDDAGTGTLTNFSGRFAVNLCTHILRSDGCVSDK